jgi:DNA-binding Lrp family transcriptional regulator
MSKPKKFKGVWIPLGLLADKKLTWADKVFIGYVTSFPGKFYAGNNHIAEKLGTTPQMIANRLTKLRKMGYFKDRHLNPGVNPLNPGVKDLNPGVIDNGPETCDNFKEPNEYHESDEVLDINEEQNRDDARMAFEPENSGRLSETETESLLVDRGFDASVASRVYETLSARGWRRPDDHGWFEDREEVERVAVALAEKFRRDTVRPKKPAAHVSQFSKTY